MWEMVRAKNSIAIMGPIERGCQEEIARCCSFNREQLAPLIAAAPDLLAALKEALANMPNWEERAKERKTEKEFDEWISTNKEAQLRRRIAAAIAKAKGQS